MHWALPAHVRIVPLSIRGERSIPCETENQGFKCSRNTGAEDGLGSSSNVADFYQTRSFIFPKLAWKISSLASGGFAPGPPFGSPVKAIQKIRFERSIFAQIARICVATFFYFMSGLSEKVPRIERGHLLKYGPICERRSPDTEKTMTTHIAEPSFDLGTFEL